MSIPKSWIFFVEDDRDHAEFIRRALAGDEIEVVHSENGEAALTFLKTCKTLPIFMLLDLKLPKMDGFQVLESLRRDERFRDLPITMLSTSVAPHEVKRAYRLGVNNFVTKSTDFKEFVRKVKSIKEFWVSVSETPRRDEVEA